MKALESGAALRVLVDDNETIWTCLDGQVKSMSGWADLRAVCKQSQTVDVFGCARHAELIRRLYDSEFRGRLRIGSPMPIRQYDSRYLTERLCPIGEVLDNTPPLAGGWHFATEGDYWSYCLIAALRASNGNYTNTVQYAFRRHPVWPVACFAASCGGQLPAAARVVGEIVDPRWFVNPEYPERDSRLRSFLGLSPKNMRLLSLSKTTRCRNLLRAHDTVLASLGDEMVAVEITPSHVFHEVLLRSDTVVKGLVKASSLFTALLRQFWLHRVAPHGNELFVPEYFFERTPFGARTAEVFARFYTP